MMIDPKAIAKLREAFERATKIEQLAKLQLGPSYSVNRGLAQVAESAAAAYARHLAQVKN